MPVAELLRVRKWPRKKRFEAAVVRVVDHGESVRFAARQYGVTRQALGPKVVEFRRVRDERVARAKSELMSKAGLLPLGLNEVRRVPDFWEFDRLYFGGLVCPDCHVHHETPDFHREIVSAMESDAKRVLINLPPYHAKSTLVTVKHTIWQLVKNPNLRTIIISSNTEMAKTFTNQIQTWLTEPEVLEGSPSCLVEDWGPFRVDGQANWSSTRFVIAGRVTAEKDPTVQALGWGNKIYGRRADQLKFDDIADDHNQSSPEQIAKMQTWINKMALTRIGKTGRATFVGTRIRHGDIYALMSRLDSYKWVRFPLILDDEGEVTLWPEHFPYSQALIHRDEMLADEFQLVYQNVDTLGAAAAFTQGVVDGCKDTLRVPGQFESGWRLVAGLDPGGGNKDSGYTAITVLGVDLATGMRYLVLSEAWKGMKAFHVKDRMLEIGRAFPIVEWRIEANGLQSQIYQYDQELVRELALLGQKVLPHFTHRNKWDPQFGVESMAPFFQAGMLSIPWGNNESDRMFRPLIEELVAFPMSALSDRVMSLWFADLAVRELLRRDHMPMFNERATARWPARVKRRRRVVDFQAREVRRVPLADQRAGHLSAGQAGYRRMTVGALTPHRDVTEAEPAAVDGFVNVGGTVDAPLWKDVVDESV